MRTTRICDWGRLPTESPWTETAWTETPNRNMGPGTETSLEGTWTRQTDRKWHHTEAPPGQTDTCENITLPQTSFADGKHAYNSVKECLIHM